PGLLATALGAAAASLPGEAAPAFGTARPGDWLRTGMFLAVGVAVSFLCGGLHAARRRAEAERGRLEREVEEHRRAEAALTGHIERLWLLNRVAHRLLTARLPGAMARDVFAEIREHFGLDAYSHFLLAESGDALLLESCAGVSEEEARALARLELGRGVCGGAVPPGSDGLRAYACYPLRAGGDLLGTLSFASRGRDRFGPDERDFFQTVSRYLTLAYERVRQIARLREQDRRKDEFLATLAHEQRNLLAPVRNGLRVLRLAGADPAAAEQARGAMERQVQHLVRLVDDLLDVARIRQGKLELRREVVDLAAVVRAAAEAGRPLLGEAGLELSLELPEGPVLLEADPARLEQVIANLLHNAARYTERGGRVRLAARREGSDAVVSVRDSGAGIPAEALPRLFDLFAQADRPLERARGGLGIGLTLVRRLAEMHGGSVAAASDGPDTGSEFTVRLPAVVTPPPGPSPACEPEPGPAAAGLRVLVVDDNRDAADSLSLLLRVMGHEVRTAYDGAAGVEVAADFRPEVALLDIGMPRMNGYDAARHIRRQDGGEKVILIALTGWAQQEERHRTREAGFDHHLVKPLDLAELESLLAGYSDTSPPAARRDSACP
ncbi:MAG TPA: ATP-binding protein, partial [Gemmataceae bacterium]